MSAVELHAEKQRDTQRIECAQIHGGNQAAQLDVALPGITGYLYSQPCQSGEGGDIHYMSICGSGLLSRFCIADVVGHGSDVTVVSNETHALLRKSINWTDNRRVLRQLNRLLVEKGIESLTTAAILSYFPPTRNLTFSYAGHPPAWHYSKSRGLWISLPTARPEDQRREQLVNVPLAVDMNTEFTRGRIRVATGDLIVITTDGIGDALNESARRFGEARVRETLQAIESPTPRNIIDQLIHRVLEHCNVDHFDHDDVTILVLRITPFSRLNSLGAMLKNRLIRPLTRANSSGE